jgi:hypothetical protein
VGVGLGAFFRKQSLMVNDVSKRKTGVAVSNFLFFYLHDTFGESAMDEDVSSSAR